VRQKLESRVLYQLFGVCHKFPPKAVALNTAVQARMTCEPKIGTGEWQGTVQLDYLRGSLLEEMTEFLKKAK
jgi:hypothetical protein